MVNVFEAIGNAISGFSDGVVGLFSLFGIIFIFVLIQAVVIGSFVAPVWLFIKAKEYLEKAGFIPAVKQTVNKALGNEEQEKKAVEN